MDSRERSRRWASRLAWALPWLVTVVLVLGLLASSAGSRPSGPLILEAELGPEVEALSHAHDLVAQQVIAAVGSVEHLPATTRRAFELTSHFSPMPIAGPDDWLLVHPEAPQTVEDYLHERPNRPEPPRDRIYVLPIGALPAARGPTTEELAEHARRYFGLEVTVLPVRALAPTPAPDPLQVASRMHQGHHQLHAPTVLDALQEELPRDAYCLIAVTLEDLYPADDFNYVFGMARLHARVGVFSFARYHPDFFGESFAVDRKVVMQRALKVMSHELGHMFGLRHCTHLHCNMNGMNHLSELDRSPMHLCPVCLRKLHLMLGFDPRARYQDLAEHYTRLQLGDAADWARQRWAFLRRAESQ